MHEHVADLKQVILEPGEGKSVHAIAQIIAYAGVIVLVEVTHRDPFAEEGGVEEPNQPSVLADAAALTAGDGVRSGDLSRGRVGSEPGQPQKPHHRSIRHRTARTDISGEGLIRVSGLETLIRIWFGYGDGPTEIASTQREDLG